MLVRRNSNWLPDVFNDLFNDEFLTMPRANATKPAVNVIEREKEYVVELAAPGMTKDDFTVTLDEDDNLVVALEKKVENTTQEGDKEQKNGHYLRREFFYSKFNQTLLLPEDVDREKIAATVEHGVLTVTLPKKTAEELKKERKVIAIS